MAKEGIVRVPVEAAAASRSRPFSPAQKLEVRLPPTAAMYLPRWGKGCVRGG